MPGHELKSRYSEQWKEIGFQGKNPATDFRGMGESDVKFFNFLFGFEIDDV
jgi:hypothetical protein